MHQLMEIMEEFKVNKAYGEIVVKIEAGKVVVIKKTETMKIVN